MTLENNHHMKYEMKENTDVRKLELTVSKLKWWKLTFRNIGIKNRFLYKIITEDRNKKRKSKRMSHKK